MDEESRIHLQSAHTTESESHPSWLLSCAGPIWLRFCATHSALGQWSSRPVFKDYAGNDVH